MDDHAWAGKFGTASSSGKVGKETIINGECDGMAEMDESTV